MDAFCMSAFAISTICWRATPSSPMGLETSSSSCISFKASLALRFISFLFTKPDEEGRLPKNKFSMIESWGTIFSS